MPGDNFSRSKPNSYDPPQLLINPRDIPPPRRLPQQARQPGIPHAPLHPGFAEFGMFPDEAFGLDTPCAREAQLLKCVERGVECLDCFNNRRFKTATRSFPLSVEREEDCEHTDDAAERAERRANEERAREEAARRSRMAAARWGLVREEFPMSERFLVEALRSRGSDVREAAGLRPDRASRVGNLDPRKTIYKPPTRLGAIGVEQHEFSRSPSRLSDHAFREALRSSYGAEENVTNDSSRLRDSRGRRGESLEGLEEFLVRSHRGGIAGSSASSCDSQASTLVGDGDGETIF